MKILKVINEKVTQDPELEDEEDIDLTATVDDGEDDVVLDSDEECECDDDTPCDIYADDPVCPCCGAKLNIITDEDDLANGDEDGFANGDEDEEEISDEEVGLDSEEPDTVDLVSIDELPEADDEDSPYYN